jgi:hypothetical protein
MRNCSEAFFVGPSDDFQRSQFLVICCQNKLVRRYYLSDIKKRFPKGLGYV